MSRGDKRGLAKRIAVVQKRRILAAVKISKKNAKFLANKLSPSR